MSWPMPMNALIMAGVAAALALLAAIILALPARSPQAAYGKRIAGMMAVAGALILALFAWGLTRMGG